MLQNVWLWVRDNTIMVIQVIKIFFVQLFCVFFPPLLDLFCFYWVFTMSLLYCANLGWDSPLIFPIFLKISLVLPFLLLPLFLCIVHWRRPSCLSLLFSGILHLVGCTFPFLPCFLFLFFPQLFVSLLRQPLCLLAFLFLWNNFFHCLLYSTTDLCP